MPIYDFVCHACNTAEERLVWSRELREQHCACGRLMDPAFTGRAPTMIRDSIRGGQVIENLGPHPKRYFSRTEIRDEMRARGVEQKVRHVGEPGSDKSKHTTRWI